MEHKALSGVHCDVESCIYNQSGKKCTASSISVDSTSRNACSCDETACRTFLSRD
ncbi:DUF1540 domain-containing protein [Ruminococcus sp. NK3A76]|uniref:DUF1540 domain-containing protein n=1 Tax=Ruminococcus sp. NK3A76 TaxID=877411 RepID=UPI0009FE1EA8|nr:DUF1540 domain-containing protein [Ruminococcus sp. NK3A76]